VQILRKSLNLIKRRRQDSKSKKIQQIVS